VELRLVARGEEPRRLEHDVDAEVSPRERRRVTLVEELELVAVDADRALRGLDLGIERAEHRVVLEQVGHRLGVAEVIDGDELDVGVALAGGDDAGGPGGAGPAPASPRGWVSSSRVAPGSNTGHALGMPERRRRSHPQI